MRTRNPAGADAPDVNARAARAAARRLGFHAVGICNLSPIERDALRPWLARGYGGHMTYLNRQARKREEPARIAPGAHRAVVVLESYQRRAMPAPGAARVARYAWGEDYHRVVGARLDQLADALVGLGARREATRAYVDTGPVPERELARRAGLGWLAKNTLLIHPRLGSYTFIGSVLTDLDMTVDVPFEADHCGTCRACLDACPTAAFAAPRVLDARRCISYLTIERRGALSPAEGALLGEWLFGCDVCQEVCPWNDKAVAPPLDPRLAARPELLAPDPETLRRMDEAEFDAAYADTAFARPGRTRMARNAQSVQRNRP